MAHPEWGSIGETALDTNYSLEDILSPSLNNISREPPHPQDAGVVRGRRLHDGGGGPAEPAPAEPGLHAGRRRGRRIGQEQDGFARFLRAGEEGRLIRL